MLGRITMMLEEPAVVAEMCKVREVKSKEYGTRLKGCGQIVRWKPAVESRPDCGCCQVCGYESDFCACLAAAFASLRTGHPYNPIVRRSVSTKPPKPYRCWSRDTEVADEAAQDAVEIWLQSGSGSNVEQFSPRKLSMCRLCEQPLAGNQTDYCGVECREIINNARKRARRSAPWTTIHPAFSLDTITVCGVGVLDMSPEQWNAIDKADQHVPGPKQPWFVPPKRPSKAEIAEVMPDRMARLGAEWWSVIADDVDPEGFWIKDDRTLDERADRLTRRYGSGGWPTPPCAREGCRNIPRRHGRGTGVFCSRGCGEAAAAVAVRRIPGWKPHLAKVIELVPWTADKTAGDGRTVRSS